MDLRQVLQIELSKLMKEDEKIVVLDADLSKPNGTAPLYKEFPNRCFNVGISEANMASVAAGLSAYGFKPIIVTFTPFATRRIFDQIAVSIAYAKQNVKIVGTDPGITAELNGGTHMSFEDVALMRSIPNMMIYDVVDEVQLSQAVSQIMQKDGNVYIRMPRKTRPVVFDENYRFTLGKADVVKEGKDVSIVATGTMVYEAMCAAKLLEEQGISAEVIGANTLKPFDKETVLSSIQKTKHVVTCENNSLLGGLYSIVCEAVCETTPMKVIGVGVNDQFGQVGKYAELLKVYHLTPEDIVEAVKKAIR